MGEAFTAMSFARPSAVGTRADDLAALPLKALAERFASQAIATQAIATLGDLNVDLFDPRVNPNGEAIRSAIRHPSVRRMANDDPHKFSVRNLISRNPETGRARDSDRRS